MKKDVIFINSHPIQYFAPMYKRMNERGVKTSCWYCSDSSVKGGFDQQFGTEVKWDIPLLDGYDYKFFKNDSWKPSHSNGFFGLINFSMIWELFKIPKSIIIVHGWHYFTLISILLIGKMRGHTICLRCELPYSQELLKKGILQKIKNAALKYIVFPRINYFLYIGEQNRLFYKSFGLPDNQLVFCPYSVDNKRFREEYNNLKEDKQLIKTAIGIPKSSKVIVFSAKYIDKKRPLDVLRAFALLNDPSAWLIMVGEGELRGPMEDLIKKESLNNVILTGFVNQSKISEYYAIGDLFVMCSGLGETWGLSANEAMNFSLPLVISKLSGCSHDLVKEGLNGYTFITGDTVDLASKLELVLARNLTNPDVSADLIKMYSYDTVAENIDVVSQR